MYLGKQIWRRLNKLSDWITGRVGPTSIEEKVNEMLTPYGAKCRIIQLKLSNKKTWFMIGGEFDPSTIFKPITIDICLNSTKKYIYFTQKRKERFLFLLSQTLQHELVHKLQWKHGSSSAFYSKYYYFTPGNSKSSPKTMQYLAMVEEIDAYAHDLAMEIKFLYPHDDPAKILKNISQYPDLNTWKMYSRTFKRARWLQVRNELLRKTYKWLPAIKEKFSFG
jgi:hypothetical protein